MASTVVGDSRNKFDSHGQMPVLRAVPFSRMPLMVRAESLFRPGKRCSGDTAVEEKRKHSLIGEAFAGARVFVQMYGDFLGRTASQHDSDCEPLTRVEHHVLPFFFKFRVHRKLLLKYPNAVRIGQEDQAALVVAGSCGDAVELLLNRRMERIGKAQYAKGLGRRRGFFSLMVCRSNQNRISSNRNQTTRQAGWIAHFRKHGGPADIRDINQRDRFSGFVFGIQIIAAVMLGGEEAYDCASGNGNMCGYLNVVLRWRFRLRMFIFGIEAGRRKSQAEDENYSAAALRDHVGAGSVIALYTHC